MQICSQFRTLAVLGLVLFSSFLPCLAAEGQRRWSEDPVTVDFDMEDVPEPTERQRGTYYDFLYSTFGLQVKEAFDLPRTFRKLGRNPKPAYNVNQLDQVPDSSWFTNRIGSRPMTLEEIRRGPNQGRGPAEGHWTVIQGKTEGITPGFLIRDAHGDVYQLKFDPPDYPEMATAAEVIASKLYYAAGYNVKENYLVVFDRGRLVVSEDADFRDRHGRARTMTEADLDAILAQVARRPNGTYRAVAGKFLDGVAKGPFPLEGVRKDDPNDWIPHEHRRDLRGLRVFASWVNENDFREGNTLDMYVAEGGRGFLRHYLIDFGSSLGSDTVYPNIERIGNEYQLDGGEIAKSLFSFGLYRRPWKNSSRVEYPAVGFLESEVFDPGRWKPNYPILPFENMTLEDAFWGTRLVVAFSDDQIRAAVETGEFSDHGATELLIRVLIERREKIGKHWLGRVNPLEGFQIQPGSSGEPVLAFRDLEVVRGNANRERREYEYSIREENSRRNVVSRRRTPDPLIPLGMRSTNPGEGVYRLSIQSLSAGHAQGRATLVYVLSRGDELKVVGIERKGN